MTHQAVGYIRVSSIDQNTNRQLMDLKLNKIFIEKISGSIKDRPILISCIEYVREGDWIYIDSIDRLARNLRDLQDILTRLIEKGVIVKFVKENLTFTGNDDAMSKLTLQMMGAFAEFERTMIRARQREGIDAAKMAGKHLGRPPMTTPKLISQAKDLKSQGVSIRQIAFRLNTSRATIYKMLAS